MELEPEEILTEVDWVDEGPIRPADFWREHLRRQLLRSVVAVLIVLGLVGLRRAGRPGRWLLEKISHATRADFSPYLAGLCEQADLRGMARTIRGWLANEWQVVSPQFRRGAAPPALAWPVQGARLMAGGHPGATGGMGLDLQVPAGSTVFAAQGGTVAEARQEQDGSITIVLQHEGGWRTVYGQCGGLLVGVGDRVGVGQPIALVGTARPPTPTHLHFEVWDHAEQVDPSPYLREASTGHGLL